MGQVLDTPPIHVDSAPDAYTAVPDRPGGRTACRPEAAAAFTYSPSGARESAEALVQLLVSAVTQEPEPLPEEEFPDGACGPGCIALSGPRRNCYG
ncbi:hypothetical protein DMH12_06010 [Streptomyces sp. WAC 04229]|uniref:hypothetical protein n=1 Tax=Streptomyces sp. WAC 04229 TaxID=2203206 RepID=UPI000F737577|nr:hypothetical protein [Streptomyces sp. WAC 04229]RSN62064.1 hypothetical protein DMH12_06010 [Streptomyces sp. WAC 04229]